jgi:uncharacterized protein (TIGR02300 family)
VSAAVNLKPSARGLKRVCVSCGIRFYDLNKRPINCPNCSTEFSGEIKLKGRRGRLPAADVAVVDKANLISHDDDTAEDSVVEAEADTVSLEDVASLEDEDTDEEALEADELGDLDDLEDVDDLEEDDAEDLGIEDEKE